MPLFEYECDSCMEGYNRDIDALVAKLNKTNATKIKKNNSGILYVEVTDDEKRKQVFALGEKSNRRGPRRFQHKISKNKVLYLELKDFRFSSLVMSDKDEKDLACPVCNSKKPRRIFSTFKAIFDDKSKRAPGPGDELRWHLEYKEQKDEEQRNDWVGQEHLNQYFNR
ncbi:MAG: hypothetical protein IH875_05985 [Candidatus Dadabacteria bacterium]|nr:hypothetical protein [Candidatus Dadabacteria bacterium]